ncbi:MAG: hypothetical protein FGM33_06690 [Candidatus Kapabacteria bacterium]|nr:hypothetical protein [Candidatus Kapabacteria bacterium]
MRALVSLCALVCATLTVGAQQRITTPRQPVRIVQTGNAVHVLCARTDLNFNGNFDDGDATAHWMTIDAATRLVIRESGFGWGSVTVQRFGVSPELGTFDIGFNDEVYRFSMATQTNSDIVFSGPNSSVSTSSDGKTVWVAQRPNFTDPGSIVEVDVATRSSNSFPAGPNPQAPLQHSTEQGSGLAVLNEGTFGGGNGSVDLWTGSGSARERTSITVGDTPNHLLIHGERAYVTVNGSHTIVVVDLARKLAIDTILVGTSGYDGPRECAIDTSASDGIDRLFVSTFSSDVRVFDLSTGQLIATLDPGAKPEGLAVVGSELWVTRTFVAGGYAVTSDVAIFPVTTSTSVAETRSSTSPSAIIAISGQAHLPFAIDKDATITDMTGKTTPISAVVSAAQIVDCHNLPAGVYVVRSGAQTATIVR